MSSETSAVRVTSLVLRVTLGVIVIWHGVDELRSDGWATFGANRAERLERRHAEPPPRTLEKLRSLPTSAWLHDEEKGKIDEGEADKLAELRRKTAEERLRRAYAAEMSAAG